MKSRRSALPAAGFLALLVFSSAGCGAQEHSGGAALASPALSRTLRVHVARDASQQQPGDPELPRDTLDVTVVAAPTRTVFVRRGDDLQQAIDRARAGDLLLLEPGARFTGNFVLPTKPAEGWVTIRAGTPGGRLPRQNERISPRDTALLATLISPNSDPALRTDGATRFYRLSALEITVATDVHRASAIVALGDYGRSQRRLEQVPSDLVLDHVYIHGHPQLNMQRCLALNSASTAVVDSYLSDCHGKGFDSQAIWGGNGPGPFKIVNNYLEGAGENVMFGGADPSIPGLVPSDIEMRRNYVVKPLVWRGLWTVKNLFELKNARRLLVEGNVFENCWADAQVGYAVVWKAVNQDGNAPWSTTRDVTFRYNVVRNSAQGVNISGAPEAQPVDSVAARILMVDNLVLTTAGNGNLFLLSGGLRDLRIEHNTGLAQNAAMMFAGSRPMPGLRVRENILAGSRYGVRGDGSLHALPGAPALGAYAPGFVFTGNVLTGADGKRYPPANFFPPSLAEVGFVNPLQGEYRLRAGSAFRSRGPNNRTVGADIEALRQATRGVSGAGQDSSASATDGSSRVRP